MRTYLYAIAISHTWKHTCKLSPPVGLSRYTEKLSLPDVCATCGAGFLQLLRLHGLFPREST